VRLRRDGVACTRLSEDICGVFCACRTSVTGRMVDR
jgi:hypothetical protein